MAPLAGCAKLTKISLRPRQFFSLKEATWAKEHVGLLSVTHVQAARPDDRNRNLMLMDILAFRG
jgi:hypothetical protein